MKEKTPGRKKCCRESFRLLRRKTCESLTSSVKFSATVSFGNVKWKRDTHGKAMSAVNTVDQGFAVIFPSSSRGTCTVVSMGERY